ncbi:MAG: hypothetical protein HYX60_09865 [Legionella longbeachae]|nr:hypothetical protein [Legionella longbeachae]
MLQGKLKLCFGIGLLSLGLTACMDMQNTESRDPQYQSYEKTNTQNQQMTHKTKPQQKTYASKDPTQKATPGPTRKAAPQIPVIQ